MLVRTPEGRLTWKLIVALGMGVHLVTVGVQAQITRPLIIEAVRTGDRTSVRSLLAGDIDVNAVEGDGSTALHWAAYLDDVSITASLIEAGADVEAENSYGVTSLGLAARNGSAAVIRLLLEAGLDPNDLDHNVNSGETPLMLASRTGQPEAVSVLIAAGANVDAQESWNGQSALMWAAAEGHASVMKL